MSDDLLKESNEVLRSAYQIALRDGVDTNWEPFRSMLKQVLEKQHRVMYPEQYEPKYRDPKMLEDFEKDVEWSYEDDQKWHKGILVGQANCKWVVVNADGDCILTRNARICISDDGWKPMESAPKDREVWAIMGGEKVKATWCRTTWCNNRPMWISRLEGRSLAWDRDNQPTAWKEIE